MEKLPKKTLERLNLYRRLLHREKVRGKENIYSHELAVLANFTSAQVRRDLMTIEHIGNPRKGYKVQNLIDEITQILGAEEIRNVALFGVGNLGKAILSYYNSKKSNTPIVACFDSDKEKAGRVIAGCRCYLLEEAEELLHKENVKIALIAVPAERAQEVTDKIVAIGIRAIVNFAPTPLKVPDHVYVQDLDISVAIDMAAYHTKL